MSSGDGTDHKARNESYITLIALENRISNKRFGDAGIAIRRIRRGRVAFATGEELVNLADNAEQQGVRVSYLKLEDGPVVRGYHVTLYPHNR